MINTLINTFILYPVQHWQEFVIFGVVYTFVGWFYVHVLGKELHDFIVLSVLSFIVVIVLVLLTNRNAQYLFFGV